ncbi:GreA/GreB family elongation factor [Patescibacteria group bacterium]|nr:GreA/GreB family elongation factor [Patescibacteria group bacterium]MBU4367469.1 GreA/GreB family elongation factor [Patescibacteria group bacterium]MBU4461789.1 GreA/GreB family elongation factor [Patescibacteria group bacterium]MCG2700173.1 GreA/GreB family elongation factor [Candidatus Parcubacteria bacterium]
MAEKIFYITKDKFEELKEEYKNLLAIEFRKTRGEMPKIFESEDINPEYLNFQEDLGFLRSRIKELENILKNYEIIKKPHQTKQNMISLGAKVAVSVEGEKDEFVVVGTLEANPSLGKISNESPVGRALMGHKVGDEIIISSPVKVSYKILKIKYHNS